MHRPVVLVVEDEVLIRLVLADWLRECGMDCLEAADADEALQTLQSDCDIDLVFTDIRMPGKLNGLDLAKWMREQRPYTPVILASAHRPPADGSALADVPFFNKPYDLAAVTARIRDLVGPAAVQRAAAP